MEDLTRVTYPVMEAFYTLQGEGHHSGRAFFFIRVAGCDVGCVWCDVKESWPEDKYPMMSLEQMEQLVEQNAVAKQIVMTGGEPFLHDMEAFTSYFRQAGYKVHVETSGAYPITGEWDWVTLSPKKFKPALEEAFGKANELKVVVSNAHDLKWASAMEEKVGPTCGLYLQPEWSKANKVTPMIVDYAKRNPRWRISLQTHKYLAIP